MECTETIAPLAELSRLLAAAPSHLDARQTARVRILATQIGRYLDARTTERDAIETALRAQAMALDVALDGLREKARALLAVLRQIRAVEVCSDRAPEIAFAARALLAEIDRAAAPVERTPEVVLRAMLRAYENAETEAVIRAARSDERAVAWTRYEAEYLADLLRWGLNARKAATTAEMVACFRGRIHDIREALADHVVKGANPLEHCVMHVFVARDYEARLRGERPLDAPPLEAP